jgi:hypothetical protein
MCSAISIATCFRFFPGNDFGFLHDAFEKFVVEEWVSGGLQSREKHSLPPDSLERLRAGA